VPGLDSTDASGVFQIVDGQPIIVERASYPTAPTRTFAAEAAGITAPALARIPTASPVRMTGIGGER
jgi:hypothetical protein